MIADGHRETNSEILFFEKNNLIPDDKNKQDTRDRNRVPEISKIYTTQTFKAHKFPITQAGAESSETYISYHF